MWVYILSVALCVCLWKVGKILQCYRLIHKALSKFPLPVDHHWFFGVAHLVKDTESHMQVVQKSVDILKPKLLSVWLTWLRPAPTVLHPDTMKDILKASHVSAPKSREYSFLISWIGEGLLCSNGKKWERSRRLLTPAFHFDVLKPYVRVYNDVAELLLDKISSLSSEGKSIDVCPLINRATLDTMLRCSLSYEDEGVQSTDQTQHPYIEAISRIKDIVIRRWMNPLLHPDLVFGMTSDSKELKKLCDYVHEFSDTIIKSRRFALEADPSQLQKRHLDFLDRLLTAKDDNGVGLTDQEIRAEVDTFMFGGHDTTGSAIMWTLHALAKHPSMQLLVRDEVEEILGDRTALEHEDLAKLKFTTCFIKECLRLYSPVPAFNRRLSEPVSIGGATFPPETVVDILPSCLHHNPAVWDNHNEFNPERFLPDNFAKKDPFAFLPFSAGQRNCIGQHFAMNEIKVIISLTVKRFEISLDETREAELFRDAVTSAKDGIYLHFKDL